MSSLSKVGGNDGTMWKCENDLLKDLALLNDFEDAEQCKILYSNGRGMKIKQKQKNPVKFIDPRTGEAIDVNDLEFGYYDNLQKGRGRGRHFGNLSNKHLQLQEQLRLARPMGSGDEAIESFCRRFQMEMPTSPEVTSTSDSDGDSQNSGLTDVSKPVAKTIGCRNSVLQKNILINGLLSKMKDDTSTEESVINSGNLTSGTEMDDDGFDDDEDEDDDDNSKSDGISDVTDTSPSVLSDKDFPPLRSLSKNSDDTSS